MVYDMWVGGIYSIYNLSLLPLGHRLKARDVLLAGLATHFIPRAQVSFCSISVSMDFHSLFRFQCWRIACLSCVLKREKFPLLIPKITHTLSSKNWILFIRKYKMFQSQLLLSVCLYYSFPENHISSFTCSFPLGMPSLSSPWLPTWRPSTDASTSRAWRG